MHYQRTKPSNKVITIITSAEPVTVSIIGSGSQSYLLANGYKQASRLDEELKRQGYSCTLNFAGGLGWFVRIENEDLSKIRKVV